MAGGTTEKFVGLYFDRRLRLLGSRVLSAGSSSATVVDPLEVFRPAIEMHANGIILVHNHPSGDGQASPEDDAVTRRIAEGCAVLGLVLLDHLVLGRVGSSTSYAQQRPHVMSTPAPARVPR
jgi:DNA repair protein RadC